MEKALDAHASELDGLRQRHQDLEKRLAAIDRHLSLTTAEQTERALLKKEKLRVKDRIHLLTAGLGQPVS
jgi:uncharacterized protein YdcH (DUF465 family)